MHIFQFPTSTDTGSISPAVELPTMDLGVGGEGLIGRKVQLVDLEDASPESSRVLREGVLGWN